MELKVAVRALGSQMALIMIFLTCISLASTSLPAGCDSDCVVTCFSNNKEWQNKCLSICGCQGDCPSLDIDAQPTQSEVDLPQFNVQPYEPIEVAPDCDKACFTNCALTQYNSDHQPYYSECWVGCNCSLKSLELESGDDQSKVQESGISLGMVAGIFWVVIIIVGVILWCKCYSGQTRISDVAGPRADVYYLMKEQAQSDQRQDSSRHNGSDMFNDESSRSFVFRSQQISPRQNQSSEVKRQSTVSVTDI